MNSKEISSRGNFSDQGTDGYKTLSHVSVDHTLIVQRSLACYTHLETFSTHFLESYLSQYDRCKLESVITKYLSTEILNKVARLYTTDLCEILHHRLFPNAPKKRCWIKEISMDCTTLHVIPLAAGLKRNYTYILGCKTCFISKETKTSTPSVEQRSL